MYMQKLYGAFFLPGSVMSTLRILTHLILKTTF